MPDPATRSGERSRVAVLISGRGTNLQALIDACAAPGAPAEIAVVIANRAGAAGLRRAEAVGIPTAVVDHHRYPAPNEFEQALNDALQRADIELVCLAGFMRILSSWLTERWRDRMLNIHPSLLPAFPGLRTHERVLAAGVRFTGCTVHFVRAEVDAGPIVVQGVVPVSQDDDPENLAARVLGVEHRCYALALDLVASGRTRVIDERVVIDRADAPATIVVNPNPGTATRTG